jgi:hypothetical protein
MLCMPTKRDGSKSKAQSENRVGHHDQPEDDDGHGERHEG